MKTFLRWIVLPIAVLLVYWLVWLANTYLIPLTTGKGHIAKYLIEIAASGIATAAGIYVAHEIAPKGKVATAIVVSCFFILFGLLSLIISFRYQNYSAASIISAITTIATSICMMIHIGNE